MIIEKITPYRKMEPRHARVFFFFQSSPAPYLQFSILVYFNINVNKRVVFTFTHLQEVIPTFDMAVNELFFERFPDSILEFQIQVRPYNALKTRNMRNLNPEGVWIRSLTPGYMVFDLIHNPCDPLMLSDCVYSLKKSILYILT